MIKTLRNIHAGMTIAIVGSGPTAIDFVENKTDISIGVNGAAKLGKRFNYFMCGDVKSPTYDWFNIDCSDTRVIAKMIASSDKILYPDESYPGITRIAVVTAKQNTIQLPCPVSPHRTFMYKWYKLDRLKKDMNYLMFGGTISCCAVQLAYVMGASKIVLYGCGFTNIGNHYFYHTRRPGSISESQRITMSTVINEVRKRGVKIEIVGNTTLHVV
jgi:hypothetical protein